MSIDPRALAVLGKPLRHEILKYYKADSCIASSSIGMLLLDGFGIRSYPLAVELLLFNAPFVHRFSREGRMPEAGEIGRWWQEDGAHSVGIGVRRGDEPGRHMVLIVDDAWLWDLSADQGARPAKGIHITEPLVGPASPGFLAGQDPLTAKHEDGALAVYRARPGYEFWTISPNWHPTGREGRQQREIVERACAETARLAASAHEGHGMARESATVADAALSPL